jgi:DNA polymerase III, delta subunit
MDKLNQAIKNKSFELCYLLYGEENYLKKNYKDKIKLAVVGDDEMNYTNLIGKGTIAREIIDIANTMPFFTEKRLIIVEDSGFFKKADDELASYIEKVPETAVLVFIETDIDKRNKLYKAVSKFGVVVECSRQKPEVLSKWVLGIMTREGKRITGNNMDLFLSKTGDDMNNISVELEKLLSYMVDKEIIDAKDIEAVCIEPITNKVFDMINYVAAGELNKALSLYRDLLISKEPPMKILFLIARQFNQLLQVKSLLQIKNNKSEIASKLRLSPYIIAKVISQASEFEYNQLKQYVEKCVEFEELVKTGGLSDRLAVELLLTIRG